MKVRSFFLYGISILAVLHFAGCANPLNQATYYRYTEEGDRARAEGNWGAAEFAYSRALTNVDWGNLPPRYRSEALYNVGEVKQVLGKHDESATYLEQALAIDTELYGPDGFVTTYTMASLAITYYKLNRIEEGVELLHRIAAAYPNHAEGYTDKFKSETVRLLGQYTEQLSERGDESEANRLKAFASSIQVGK